MTCNDETTELFGIQDDALTGHYCHACDDSFQDEEVMLPVKILAPVFDAMATGQTDNPSLEKPSTSTAHHPDIGVSHEGQHGDNSSPQTAAPTTYATPAFQVNPRRCHCEKLATSRPKDPVCDYCKQEKDGAQEISYLGMELAHLNPPPPPNYASRDSAIKSSVQDMQRRCIPIPSELRSKLLDMGYITFDAGNQSGHQSLKPATNQNEATMDINESKQDEATDSLATGEDVKMGKCQIRGYQSKLWRSSCWSGRKNLQVS
ncbi:hypothetical protein SEMRO_1742_G294740.1 [Seminavis robusta]|uniref:Uncharacterized protein n=1 Tax=Seminavis robusta TaxID=568900 RepID=A0A9N8HV45_9STRA|nr:hypothetical protein SEMRO_1742_G294740.1 [Seminavis robusta]|eukprot:Sro1742_g294740.1 n/a (261) ;mRNA; r:12464-13246